MSQVKQVRNLRGFDVNLLFLYFQASRRKSFVCFSLNLFILPDLASFLKAYGHI